MLFQTLDDKAECVGIYTNKEMIFDPDKFPDSISQTWSYSPYLRGRDIDYASLFLEGRSLAGCIPEYLRDDWDDVSERILAFKRSLSISKVNQDENCFFDLVPERFLVDFCEVKNRITEHVLQTMERPKRYGFYKHVSMLLGDIASQPINVDKKKLLSYTENPKTGGQARSLLTSPPYVRYKQFGTKTGRLTTDKNSFPILTLNKHLRSIIKPQNDMYVEFDFNGAEIRTLLGLLDEPQPKEDVHQFHLQRIFNSSVTREQAKVYFFSWLYGSREMSTKQEGKELEKFYDREKLLKGFYNDNQVTTPYGKTMKDVSRHHALNYLVQSTTAELTLKQALKIDYLLRTKGSGSKIAFLIHDAIVLDLKKEDKHLLPSVFRLMKSTNFGEFGVNTKSGKCLGTLREFEIG